MRCESKSGIWNGKWKWHGEDPSAWCWILHHVTWIRWNFNAEWKWHLSWIRWNWNGKWNWLSGRFIEQAVVYSIISQNIPFCQMESIHTFITLFNNCEMAIISFLNDNDKVIVGLLISGPFCERETSQPKNPPFHLKLSIVGLKDASAQTEQLSSIFLFCFCSGGTGVV